MKCLMILLTVLTMTFTACATQRTGTVTSSDSVEPTRTVATAGELPAGTTLRAELDRTLGEETPEGEAFTATVTHSVTGPDGEIVVPAGAKIHGEVTGIDRSENINDPAAIRLHLTELAFEGDRHPLQADIVSTELTEDRDKSDIVRNVGIGTAAGAILGGVISGEAEGAIVGGALGAGAGTLVSLGTGDVDPELKQGTEMVLRTTDEIAIATR